MVALVDKLLLNMSVFESLFNGPKSNEYLAAGKSSRLLLCNMPIASSDGRGS